MLNSYEPLRRTIVAVVYYVSCLIASAMIFAMFLRVGLNGFWPAPYLTLVEGTAYKPFVYRALLPFCVRMVASAVPVTVQDAINEEIAGNKAFVFMNNKWGWETHRLTEYVIGCIFMYLSLIGFFFALRYLFRTVYDAPAKLVNLVALLGLLGLPMMFKYHSYIYDFSTLFLFTFGVALMARGKWTSFLGVYSLACFNKETSILLTLLFAINFWLYPVTRLSKRLFMKMLSAQLAIYFVTRIILVYFFHDNPGQFLSMGPHTRHNLTTLPYSINAVNFLMIVLMVLYKWAEKPILLKNGLWVLVPLLFLCFLFGFLDELRDYYEVYPFVVLLVGQTIGDIVGLKATPRVPADAHHMLRT